MNEDEGMWDSLSWFMRWEKQWWAEGQRVFRWLDQKDALRQDVLLLGNPASLALRRYIAVRWCIARGRAVELVNLTRDHTESDLKQRRELAEGGRETLFEDQGVLRAALKGGIVLLEGLERAERNVLPVLNNLLENREMQLEDGRFLMAPARYDAVMADPRTPPDSKRRLVKVSERFRIIALGTPTPPFAGNPLDPPLRSRFQCRRVDGLSEAELLAASRSLLDRYLHLSPAPSHAPAQPPSLPLSPPQERLDSLFRLLVLLRQIAARHPADVPSLAEPSFLSLVRLLLLDPSASPSSLLSRIFPWTLLRVSSPDARSLLLSAFDDQRQDGQARETKPPQEEAGAEGWLWERCLECAGASYAAGQHICVVSTPGGGKTQLVADLVARLEGRERLGHFLYRDMSARDLLQRRGTSSSGATLWIAAPLVQALKSGAVVVLDGIDRLVPGTIAQLAPLVSGGMLFLSDGSKFVHQSLFGKMVQHPSVRAAASRRGLEPRAFLESRRVFAIHPRFRIIATANEPSRTAPWLTGDVLSLFHFFRLPPVELRLLFSRRVASPVPEALTSALTELRASIERLCEDPMVQLGRQPLSLRNCVRLARRVAAHGAPDALELLENISLFRYMTPAKKQALLAAVTAVPFFDGLRGPQDPSSSSLPKISVADAEFDGGSSLISQAQDEGAAVIRLTHSARPQDASVTLLPRRMARCPELVPDVFFVDNLRHLRHLLSMARDWLLGEHLLLIGEQGVGKNKLADHFCQLLNAEREYQQLHADTTVHSLTLVPSLLDGVIVFEDSPLVCALVHGRVLILDEADKAPVEVVLVVKQLLSDGEILLPDGRLFATSSRSSTADPNALPIHADFRILALANRPGYPFLGNELMVELGDSFSIHVVENPDFSSELSLLRAYGPDLSAALLRSICLAFADLRGLVEEGILNYPYSTREAVNIVKHIQAFPAEGFHVALRNVFDFDSFDPELQKLLFGVFNRHGLPTVASSARQELQQGTAAWQAILARTAPLPKPSVLGTLWQDSLGGFYHRTSSDFRAQIAPEEPLPPFDPPSHEKPPPEVHEEGTPWQPVDSLISHRVGSFSEQIASWTVRTGRVLPSTLFVGDMLVLLTLKPLVLHTFVFDRESGAISGRHLHLAPRILRYLPGDRFSPSCPPLLASFSHRIVAVLDPTLSVAVLVDPLTQRTRVFSLPLHLPSFSDASEGPRLAPLRLFQVQPGAAVGVFSPGSHRALLLRQHPDSPWQFTAQAFDFSAKIELDHVSALHPQRWLIATRSGALLDLSFGGQDPAAALCALQPVFSDYAENLLASMPKPPPNGHFVQGALAPLSADHPSAQHEVFSGLHRRFCNRTSTPTNTKTYLHVFSSPDQVLAGVHVGFPPVPPPDSQYKTKTHCALTAIWKRPAGQAPRSRVLCSTTRIGAFSSRVLTARTHEGECVLEVVDFGAQVSSAFSFSSVAGSKPSPVVDLVEGPDGRIFSLQEDGTIRVWEVRLPALEQQFDAWRSLYGTAAAVGLERSGDQGGGREGDGGDGGDGSGGEGSGGSGGEGSGGSGGEGSGGKGSGGGGGGSGGGGGAGGILADLEFNLADDGSAALSMVELAAGPSVADQTLLDKARLDADHAIAKHLGGVGMAIDSDQYAKLRATIAPDVAQLRVILEQVEANEKERAWVKLQVSGDLDDTRLVDLAVGDKNVYKKRADVDPIFRIQRLPKRIRFVVDMSSSMSRFNGVDRRLDRMAATLVMIFEAFDGFGHKYSYSVVGHDGESAFIPLVDYDAPPATREERKKVVEKVYWNASFCASGDNTLAAAQHAIKEVTNEQADDWFVFVISDANLDQYGVSASALNKIIYSEPRVHTYFIFLAGGRRTQSIISQLPVGHGYALLDTGKLPTVFKQIFSQNMLASPTPGGFPNTPAAL